eukprot:Tamp_17769.p1 GENE.Tamp_17769~~Tamp_17769.p1  ORF type:complete len:386 (-),score=71.68 Tamp_17769:212-1264(-)
MSQTVAAGLEASCGAHRGGGGAGRGDAPAARDISYDDLDKFKYYTIGPACAFMCRFALYPFSLVKTRLQMQKGGQVPTGAPRATAGIGAGSAADCIRYTGTFDAFGKILRHEGPRGLFKGFAVSCIGIISGQLYITTYEVIRQEAKRLNDAHRVFNPHTMDVVRNGVAGGTASLLAQTVVVPVDIVSQKQMMMSKVRQPPSMIHLSREILAREGAMGFYRGFFASVMVYAPSSAIWWSSYGFIRRKLTHLSVLTNSTATKHHVQATSGAMAGIVATLATNPIDVARTRLQVQGTVCGSSNTLRGVLATLWKEEGPKSLMKGVQPRILATVPSSIMIVTVYEFVKEWSVRK